jgi:hypothetical protein
MRTSVNSTMNAAKAAKTTFNNAIVTPIKEELIRQAENDSRDNVHLNALEAGVIDTALLFAGAMTVGIIPTTMAMGMKRAYQNRAAYRAGQRSAK